VLLLDEVAPVLEGDDFGVVLGDAGELADPLVRPPALALERQGVSVAVGQGQLEVVLARHTLVLPGIEKETDTAEENGKIVAHVRPLDRSERSVARQWATRPILRDHRT
jgi:hypothetical protein